MVIASTFDVEIENESGTIEIVIPYQAIEDYKKQLSTGYRTELDKSEAPRLDDIFPVDKIEHEITVTSKKTVITLDQVESLKVGDTIPICEISKGENLVAEGFEASIDGDFIFACSCPIKKENEPITVTVTNTKKRCL